MVPKYHITARITGMAQVPDANLGPLADEVAKIHLTDTMDGLDGPGAALGHLPNFFPASNMPFSTPNRSFSDHAVGDDDVGRSHCPKT